MDNKKSKVMMTLVIILSMIVVVLGTYIVVDKLAIVRGTESKDNNEEKKDKDEKKEEVTFTDARLQEFIDYIMPCGFEASEDIYGVDGFDATTSTSRDRMNYLCSYIVDKSYDKQAYTSNDKNGVRYDLRVVSEEIVRNRVELVYGPGVYERISFPSGCGAFKYDESDGNFYSGTGCGGTSNLMVNRIIVGYKANKSKLEITTAYAIADFYTGKIYSDYEMTNEIYDIGSNDYTIVENKLKEYVKENESKLNHIVYTYESSDGVNFYFTNFKNIKQ